MTSTVVQKYLTQDLSSTETKSYLEYINGDKLSVEWIEKVYDRREPLLFANIKCTEKLTDGVCNDWVHIKETGVCMCVNNHKCYDVVIKAIEHINSTP